MSKNLINSYLEDLAADAEGNGISGRKGEYSKNRQQNEKSSKTQKGRDKRKAADFLSALKKNANLTLTENGAATWRSSGSYVLDLFSFIGALRDLNKADILRIFYRAWAENSDFAMKILFYARDIRGGLGERRVFRTILRSLSEQEPESVRKNLELIPFYGRFDDLLTLLGTSCETDALNLIREKLASDMKALADGDSVSLAAKWLPSINASSEKTRQQALTVARGIGMTNAEYRKTLSALRRAEKILENRLRERDYRFSYEAQPAKALFKYQKAFLCNDSRRYNTYLNKVQAGKAKMHTSTLMPYELVRSALKYYGETSLDDRSRKSLDVMWNALPDYTDGRNALAVIDGSGSMYWGGNPLPAEVALSLGMYFAEHNTGLFKNHFITFSTSPQLVEIQGFDFVDRVRYCSSFNECANTDIQAVFELILYTAVGCRMPQSEIPETIYIISDMEFDCCMENAGITNFEYVKNLYKKYGYRLPNLVFWNVQSRNQQVPVLKNEQGAALVSGASPRIFSMVMKNEWDPYEFMMNVINSDRYAPVHA